MRHRDLELGHLLVEEGADLRDVLDARADVEALATAIALAQKGLADGQGVEGRNEASHREAIDRRGRDDRELAHAREGELQGARNGRRREGENMHLGAQLLQTLLMSDAEMLLLVDDDEAEPLELHRFREQRMRADDDVDRAVGDAELDRLELAPRRRNARLARS